MNTDPSNSFDDPDLKQALHGLLKDHRADDRLRREIERRFNAERRDTNAGAPTRRLPLGRFAAAATILIALGAAGYGLHAYRAWTARQAEIARIEAAQNRLLDAMIAAHHAKAPDDRPLSTPLSDAPALATEASAALERPVPRPTLDEAGFTLDAAAYCTVNGTKAVRFHFTDAKGRTATLVSMPTAAWDGLPGMIEYSVGHASHTIVGYRHEGSLNCVVADASIPQGDVEHFRNLIQFR